MARTLRPAGPRQLTGRRAGLLAGAIAAAAVAVAGCGSVAAPATGSGSGGAAPKVPARQALCARPSAAARVVIARTIQLHVFEPVKPVASGGSMPKGRGGPRPIVVKTVTSAAPASALARAICGLPPMHSRMNCPAMMTGEYLLSFTSDGRRLPVITIQSSGCRLVTGLSTVRRASTPSFWKLLTTISGSPPSGPFHLPGCAKPVTPRDHKHITCALGQSHKPWL